MNHIKRYAIASLILFFTDYVYIQFIKQHFINQIMLVQKDIVKINYFAVFLCYVMLTVGFYYFAVMKRFSNLEIFMLGFMVYGVYETTNWALFRDWNVQTVVIDTTWGGLLFLLTKIMYRFVMK